MDDIIFPKKFHNPVKLLEELKTEPEAYWIKRGEKRALQLFHLAAQRVPAYKDFLKKNHINFKTVKTIKDFKQLPWVDKDNYLRKYSLEQLCWDGQLKNKRWTIAATSGSTGEPIYFPREKEQDLQYAATAELYLLNNFQIDKKSTLYIDGFGMGVWIGGVFTYQAIKLLAERGKYQLSIITPGSSKVEIIKALQNLGRHFDQVIIGGYPPLIKDTIDDGIEQGVDWQSFNPKFIFSAEGFSEDFRNYIVEKTELKNALLDTLNHYGTVDQGTIAHETPISILIRRLALSNKELYNLLFKGARQLPTLAQYIPELFYFEETEGRLYCTAASGLPLTRYDLKDHGSVLSFKRVVDIFQEFNIDIFREAKRHGVDHTIWNLPFVYVYERSDFTVKLSGANIYADDIRRALQKKEFFDIITGKFFMQIKNDKNLDEYLEVNVEMKQNKKQTKALENTLEKSIIAELLRSSSEYTYLYANLPLRRLTPRIVFWTYEDPTYFKTGGKHKWVKKM